MSREAVIRSEPGAYRLVARYGEDGNFSVLGESVEPITLTLRVEDVWNRLPPSSRRYSYRAEVRKDRQESPVVLTDVAPDARIFIEFEKTFEASFT
jgi:hypothetical protein